jgi:hypothetical protein
MSRKVPVPRGNPHLDNYVLQSSKNPRSIRRDEAGRFTVSESRECGQAASQGRADQVDKGKRG